MASTPLERGWQVNSLPSLVLDLLWAFSLSALPSFFLDAIAPILSLSPENPRISPLSLDLVGGFLGFRLYVHLRSPCISSFLPHGWHFYMHTYVAMMNVWNEMLNVALFSRF
jgi:putative exporter of polyketide antibiotics